MKLLNHRNIIVLAIVGVVLLSALVWGSNNQKIESSTQNRNLPENTKVSEVVPPSELSAPENQATTTVPEISNPPEEKPTPTESKEPLPPVANSGCYVGGCSNHVCSNSKDIMTTCEWREEYACYQRATCEKQTNGQCGWSDTPELRSCLLDNSGNQAI